MRAAFHRARNSVYIGSFRAYSAGHWHSASPPPVATYVSSSGASPTTASTAALEYRPDASGREHGCADCRSHACPDVSLHNSLREERNERNAKRQKDAGKSKEQRSGDAVESADEIPAVEYRVHRVHVDGRHQRTED